MFKGILSIVVAAGLAARIFKKRRSDVVDPSPDRQPLETLRFLFDKRLALFNTRREHEWRVSFGAMITIGAVDAGLLTQKLNLSALGISFWILALSVLFGAVTLYQLGVQGRNRVDRLVMDQICQKICDLEEVPANSPIRGSMDIADDKDAPGPRPLFSGTYLWAFYCQTAVLATGCVLSACLPFIVKGYFTVPALSVLEKGADAEKTSQFLMSIKSVKQIGGNVYHDR